jgi:hypothetical protein
VASRAVAITTGRSDSEKRSRRRFSTSMPVSPGIITSEQHQRELLLLDHREGTRAVLGHGHLEAAAAEPPREHVPVELVVVHHQQAHAARLERLRGRPQRRQRGLSGDRRRVVGGVAEDGGGGRWSGVAPRRKATVDQLERAARGRLDLLQVGRRTLLSGVLDLVLEQLRVADDLVQRRPQIVAEPRPIVGPRVAHGRAKLGVITLSRCRKMKWSK